MIFLFKYGFKKNNLHKKKRKKKMESRCFAIALLFLILNASFSVPAAASAATFTVQIESVIRNVVFTACDLNGRRFPRQEIRSLRHANFTVNLKHAGDFQALSCSLLSGDKHGRFVLFDNLEWDVSAYCARDFVCQWKVVSEGICLHDDDVSGCYVAYYWSWYAIVWSHLVIMKCFRWNLLFWGLNV